MRRCCSAGTGIDPSLAATRPASPRATSAERLYWPETKAPASDARASCRFHLPSTASVPACRPRPSWSPHAPRRRRWQRPRWTRRNAPSWKRRWVSAPGGEAAAGQAAVKDLEDQQRARAKRLQRDAIDRALTELTGWYRDVLSIQTHSGAALVNSDLEPQIAVLASKSTPEATLRRIDRLLACRVALEGNVAPLLAVEAALIGLVDG